MPGLPLFGSHKRYKSEESALLRWLKTSAQKCGYQSKEGINISPSSSRGKSKKNDVVSSKAIVPIAELAPLARVVTAQFPSYGVISSYAQLLRDIIQGRKKSNRFYEQQSINDGGEDLKSSNEGHLHYIKVLEDVLSIFDGAMRKYGKDHLPNGPSMKSVGGNTQLSNFFELLEVEDSNSQNVEESVEHNNGFIPEKASSSTSSPAPTTSKTKKRSKPKSTQKASPPPEDKMPEEFDYEIEEDDSDIYFLIYCFFEDFNEIREYLQERWCDYLDGLLSLQAVALITNTAYDIFQRSETELMSLIPRNSGMRGFEDMAMMLFAEAGLAHVDYDSMPTEGEEAKNAMSDDADWVCLPVYWTLSRFLKFSPPNKLPTQPPTPLEETATVNGADRGDPRIEWGNAIMQEILLESCLVKALVVRSGLMIPAQDELTRGLVQMMKTRRIPIWLVFAAQVYLDMRYILETNVVRAHKELLAMGPRIRSTLGNYMALAKQSGVITRGPILTTVGEVKCFVTEDFMEPSRTNLHVEHGRPRDSVEPFFYLHRQPILCGLLIFKYNLTLQEYGLKVGNAWGATLAAAHLYNAIRRVTPESEPWQDMEALIAIHGEGQLFVGGRPYNIEDCATRFLLASGASVTNFAPDQVRPQKDLVHSKNGPREMKPTSVVSQIFHERYCFTHETTIHTLSHVEELLNNQLPTKLILANMPDPNLQPKPSSAANNGFGAGEDDSQTNGVDMTEQFERFTGLSPVQLLDTLAKRVTDESVLLSFNYFSMHERCSRFLLEIFAEFQSEIELMNGGRIEGGIEMSPVVAKYVFELISNDQNGTNKVAERLGNVLTTFVEREGNAEIVAVREIILKSYM